MKTFEKGDIIEMKVVVKALKLGYEVFKPISSHSSTDLILNKDGILYKVQVKSCNFNYHSVAIGVKKQMNYKDKSKIAYTKKEVDWFITYCKELKRFYRIPIEVTGNRRSVSLALRKTRNNGKEIMWAKDFIWKD